MTSAMKLSLRDAGELAEHAQRVGADAVSIAPPNYFKPASVESLVDCIAACLGPRPDAAVLLLPPARAPQLGGGLLGGLDVKDGKGTFHTSEGWGH